MSGLNSVISRKMRFAVADVCDVSADVGFDLLGGQRLGDGVKRRLGILDDQKPRRAEGDDALANLGPDRAAAAGDNHGLVFHQGFQPRIVDGGTRPQQQVFDRDRRKARRFTPPSSDGRRLTINRRRLARIMKVSGCASASKDEGNITARAIGLLRRAKSAATSSMSSMLPSTGTLRINWPRSASEGERMPIGQIRFTRAAFDAAQQHLGISRAADQKRRRSVLGFGVMADPRIAEITIGKAQRAERGDFKKPIEDDGYLAEKEGAVHVGRHQDVVQHQQRNGQHRGRAQDVEGIRQRDEAPFSGGEIEEITNRDAEREEVRQDAQHQRQAFGKLFTAFETQIEGGQKTLTPSPERRAVRSGSCARSDASNVSWKDR